MMIYKNNLAVHAQASGTTGFHKNLNCNPQRTELKSR
jgi:hypothetical protein